MQNRENERAEDEEKGTEGSKKAAEEVGGRVQYSIANTRKMSWQEQIKAFLSGKLKSSDSLYLGMSEEFIKDVDSSPRYIPTSIITKAMREQKGSRSAHGLTRGDIENLEKGIDNAVAVIYNPERNAVVYIAQEGENGGQIVASFDINNNLFGENAHKSTSIHARESIVPMLEKLGENAIVFVKNKNKFNELAGLQSDNPPELLASVELVDDKVSQPVDSVKTQKSEEDNSVSDRELLLEAAEREGAGEELRRYAQKARNLEAYQKRLERQQKMLGEMKTESPSLADASQPPLGKGALQALEKRIAETEKLIANTQTAMTRKTKLRKRMFSELCAFLLFTSRSRRPWSRAGDGP